MPYRADIEGLRGIAVALVLLFHLGVPQMGYGHLGVDIFFVISGYLITRILLRDLETGSFSLIEFYRRRVVRLLPALLVMLVLVCIAGSQILLPVEIREMAWSAAAAAGFVSNHYFWAGDGYFDLTAVRPLLHTWSLGVEEQFYLFYPIGLVVLWRWIRARPALWLWGATLASLALSLWLGRDRFDAAFYLLPSRGWELGLGAVVAAGGFPKVRAANARAALAGFGLIVLAGPLVLIQLVPGVTPAPGAIPLCIAAALLLAYGDGAPSARLLSLAPLRWLGRISYSLYLWHFPVIALYRLGYDPEPGLFALSLLAGASIAAGALSYRFVELPFRHRYRQAGDPKRIVAAGVAACVATGLAGAGLAYAAPYVRPLPPETARIADYISYRHSAAFTYQHGPVDCYGATRPYTMARCLAPDPARRNVIVLGDSYAAHLWRAVAERFPDDKVMLAASGGCRPLVGGRGSRLCRDMFDQVMREAIATRRVQSVVLAAHWKPYERHLLSPTIRALQAHGVTVTVVGPVATYRMAAPRVIAMAQLNGDPGLPARLLMAGPGKLDPRMRDITESLGARYYSIYDRECPAGRCALLTRGGVPFHFDDAHFTLAGARELVEGMERP